LLDDKYRYIVADCPSAHLCMFYSTAVAICCYNCCNFSLICNSSTVHLLAAHRPKSRRSSGTGDRTHVQDGQGSVQPAGKGLDTQVRHVALCARPLADTTCQLLLAVSIVFMWSTHSLLLVHCACYYRLFV